jgi:hypothetical protein
MASNEENDEVAAYLARERAALGMSGLIHVMQLPRSVVLHTDIVLAADHQVKMPTCSPAEEQLPNQLPRQRRHPDSMNSTTLTLRLHPWTQTHQPRPVLPVSTRSLLWT